MNSLNDARECYDPETESSSGFSHVPSQPVSIPSLRGLISSDSSCSLVHGTHLAYRETFSGTPLLRVNLQQLSLEIREVWPQHSVIKCL